ncbi:MAG: glycosyltransferase family 2 protein, partial [Actinomycetota bacterium]|nr:glycosyltransferase family 2 protein [Actinomycetota bacterium]
MSVIHPSDAPAWPLDGDLDLDHRAERDLPERGAWVHRLLVQRGFFAAPFDQVPDDLYCIVESGDAARGRDEVAAQPHSRVSMNTFFGRFPASYWQRWTSVTEVRLEATVSGTGALAVVASDPDGCTRTVQTVRVAGARDEAVTLSASIDRFVDGGALWLEAVTGDGALTVRGVRWSVGAARTLRPTAVVMCTFNRPDDCLQTLAVLTADPDSMTMVDAVYVIDQGTDTVDSREEFRHISNLLGPKLCYRQQPNLGG